MSDDLIQLCSLIIAIVYTAYSREIPVFAWFWDLIAKLTGAIANTFGKISINARLAYFEAVRL